MGARERSPYLDFPATTGAGRALEVVLKDARARTLRRGTRTR